MVQDEIDNEQQHEQGSRSRRKKKDSKTDTFSYIFFVFVQICNFLCLDRSSKYKRFVQNQMFKNQHDYDNLIKDINFHKTPGVFLDPKLIKVDAGLVLNFFVLVSQTKISFFVVSNHQKKKISKVVKRFDGLLV